MDIKNKDILLPIILGILLIGIASAQPTVSLISPSNNSQFNTNVINLSCSATSNLFLSNISLLINGINSYNVSFNNNFQAYTEAHGLSGTAPQPSSTPKTGAKIIATTNSKLSKITQAGSATTAYITDSNKVVIASGTFTDGTNANMPNVTMTAGNVYYILMDANGSVFSQGLQYSHSFSSSNITGTNINWIGGVTNDGNDNSNGIFGITSIQVAVGNQTNSSTINTSYTFQNIGKNNWTCQSSDNNSQSTIAPLYNFNISSFIGNIIYNTSSYETKLEKFLLNISILTQPSNIIINYNGTNYTGTSTTYSQNNYILSSPLINIPTISSIGNKSFYFIWNSNGNQQMSNTYNQYIDQSIFGFCNSTLNTPYINYTFEDESNLIQISANIPFSSFSYWLGDGKINKTITYINNAPNPSYAFCFYPNNNSITLSSNIQYLSSGYPQRTTTESETLNSSVTNRVYYLLNTSLGIYVTFQVISPSKQAISGVSVNATRVINGTTVVVANGVTDSAGGVTFWLNPDFQHIVTFSKSGYNDFIFTVVPTQSSYTITLGGGGGGTPSINTGITPIISPTTSFLNNNTNYTFSLSFTSQYWSINNYGFNLYYDNGTYIGNVNGSSGTISLNTNTINSNSITMAYFYIVNGTTSNAQQYWIVHQSGNIYSIANFFTDLGLYINSSFFGIDNFGKAIISLLIIVMVTGGLSYRYGIVSEPMIAGVLFGLVLFLDSLGFIPNPSIAGITPIPHLITFLTAFILIAMVLREESR